MEHVYATLLLNEADQELNERNLTAVLEAAGCAVTESRTKALVAALEGVEVDEFAGAGGGGDADEAQSSASARTSADDTPSDRESSSRVESEGSGDEETATEAGE